MAKKQKHEDIRFAVNKKALKNARAQAALEQSWLEKRLANREKSRRMGTTFLLGFLALVGLFCLYTLIRTLCFRRAASLEELRANLLFVSAVSIPYLLGFGAYLLHRLLKNRRENWSERSKRLGTFLVVLAVAVAFVLFGIQFRNSRRDASAHPAYTETLDALKQSGLAVREPESVNGVKTLLEEAVFTELRCGDTRLRLNWHAGSSGWIAGRFWDQAAWDYEKHPLREAGELRIWEPLEPDGSARAALALRRDGAIRVIELSGPKSDLETLLPLLAAALDR